MYENEVEKQVRGLDVIMDALKNDLDLTDPETVVALIEGETNLAEACQAVLDDIDEKEVLLVGLKAKIDQFSTRQSVIKDRIERRRAMLLMVLERIPAEGNKQPRLELPSAVLNRSPTPRKVEVDDEDDIPAKYWKRPDPVLSKKPLLEDLKDLVKQEEVLRDAAHRASTGEERSKLLSVADEKKIPGCHLSEQGYTLRITR